MASCNICGDEIEFRYIDGRPTPIHINGTGCLGARGNLANSSSTQRQAPFSSETSFINPNAICPVCNERVYYYQSPYGGRVFFDDVGWPWDKHECTDNQRAQTEPIKKLTQDQFGIFRNRLGEPLDLYQLDEIKAVGPAAHLKFRRLKQSRSFKAIVSVEYLYSRDIRIKDLELAPSFVVQTYEKRRVIEFISGRKQAIMRFTVSRPKRPQ